MDPSKKLSESRKEQALFEEKAKLKWLSALNFLDQNFVRGSRGAQKDNIAASDVKDFPLNPFLVAKSVRES